MKGLYFILLPLLAIVVSCGVFRSSNSSDFIDLESTEWRVVELKGVSLDAEDGSYTVTFNADGTANGKGACNLFMGNYNQGKKGELTISPAGSTRMACPGMDVEQEYMQALGAVTSYKFADDKLSLSNNDGVLLELVRVE